MNLRGYACICSPVLNQGADPDNLKRRDASRCSSEKRDARTLFSIFVSFTHGNDKFSIKRGCQPPASSPLIHNSDRSPVLNACIDPELQIILHFSLTQTIICNIEETFLLLPRLQLWFLMENHFSAFHRTEQVSVSEYRGMNRNTNVTLIQNIKRSCLLHVCVESNF